jgi:endo-1,4-beta-xylanase
MRLGLLSLALAYTSPAAQWRATDGTLSAPPPEAQASADSALVQPNAGGSPVFAAPFTISAGDVVSVRLEVEAVSTADDAGAEGQAGVVLTALPASSRHNNNPDGEHRQIVIVGSERESIRFAFRSRAAHAAGQLLLVPTLSYFGRPLRLSAVAFETHGPDADPQALTAAGVTYLGQAPDAPWRAEAARRIDLHRKAPLRLVATNRIGQPIDGITVSVEQLRHAYPFGTAIVFSRIVDAPRVFAPESGMTTERWLHDNARYREEILRNFNTIVTENDLKWPQWDGSNERPENFDQQWTLSALEWFRRHDIAIKGHTLVWGSWRFTPPWLRDHEADPATVHRAALTHIRDIGHATADRAAWWDVLNEPMSHRNVIDLVGTERVAEWFKEARAALPGTRLVMNEFDLVGNGGNAKRRADFISFLREIRSHGAPLDVLGLQGHFWSERFTAPEDIWRIADELHEASGLPLMISEFDTNVPNEQLQADYTRDFLTAWFAHPATEAFIMWGFWGGAHWMGDAGSMIRRDWTPKPVLQNYRDLVFRDWWTRATLSTDTEGSAELRAFLGRHRVTFTAPGGKTVVREIDLSRGGRELHVILP